MTCPPYVKDTMWSMLRDVRHHNGRVSEENFWMIGFRDISTYERAAELLKRLGYMHRVVPTEPIRLTAKGRKAKWQSMMDEIDKYSSAMGDEDASREN